MCTINENALNDVILKIEQLKLECCKFQEKAINLKNEIESICISNGGVNSELIASKAFISAESHFIELFVDECNTNLQEAVHYLNNNK